MSVAIKGMEIPINCTRCPCSDDDARFCRAANEYIPMLGKPDFCPLIEVEPERKTGEWNFVGNQMFECTSCGVAYTEYQFEKMRVHYNDPKFPRFCPNCGARMEDEG